MLDFENGSMDWNNLEKNLNFNPNGNEKKDYTDSRMWSLSRDENENGIAIIRLIPDGESSTPFIQRFSHNVRSFDAQKKKFRFYSNESPSTIGLPCPVNEFWSLVYNHGTEEAKLESRSFSRKINFLTNIKVIKDVANPQNDGKIFLWKFGSKLKDKILQALNPSAADRKLGDGPKQLYNVLTGNNLRLKSKMSAGFPNYDDSSIEEKSAIYASNTEAIADIMGNSYKLMEFQKPESFLSYEELKKKLKWVIETYEVKHMDQHAFKSIVNGFFGVPEEEEKKQAAPLVVDTGLDFSSAKKENKPAAPKPMVEVDDDLSFLDNL